MEDSINKVVNINLVGNGLNKVNADLDSANENIDNLNENFNETTKVVGDMRKQLREANKELLTIRDTFGETSIEAIDAAKKVANLKDSIGDAKAMADSFKPGGGFKAVAESGEMIASGLAAATGGMAIFGEQSEAVEKTLLKVQAAMALSQSLGKLADVGDTYKNLKAVIVGAYVSMTAAKTASTIATEANVVAENQSFVTKAKNVAIMGVQTVVTGAVTAAQWAWNVAMASNPIGLLVMAIAAVIAGCYLLISAFQSSSEEAEKSAAANKKLSKEIDNLEKSTKKSNEALEEHNQFQLDMAKANGKSSESIRKLAQELANQEVVEKKLNLEKAKSIFLEANRVSTLEGATDAQKETTKKALEYYASQVGAYNSSIDSRRKLALSQRVEIAEEQTKAREDLVKHNEELAKKQKEADEKAHKAHLERLAKAKKLEEEAYNLNQKRLAESNKAELASLDEIDKITHENQLAKMSDQDAESAKIDDKYAKALESAIKFGQDTAAIEEAIRREKQVVTDTYEAAEIERELQKNKDSFDRKNATWEEQRAFDIEQSNLKYQEEILLHGKTEEDKARITQEYSDITLKIKQDSLNAEKEAVKSAAEQGMDAMAESFGLAKELAVAKMIMAAPAAIGNSFKMASETYVPPLSFAMGALGAATTVVPIIKGLADIKKARFSGSRGKGGGGGGTIASATTAVGNIGANNALRMGVDPSLAANAAQTANANISGGTSSGIIFSEGKYKDFQGQVKFKEGKSSM